MRHASRAPRGSSGAIRLVSAALILILVVMAGLIYSPWHRHGSAARQACMFSPLESSPGIEAKPSIQLEPSLNAIWIAAAEPLILSPAAVAKPHFDRAPPA